MYGALNDPHFVLLVLSCAAIITIGSIVTALNRIPRAEFARLQIELKELSKQVRALEVAEQRRFLRDLTLTAKLEKPRTSMGALDLKRGRVWYERPIAAAERRPVLRCNRSSAGCGCRTRLEPKPKPKPPAHKYWPSAQKRGSGAAFRAGAISDLISNLIFQGGFSFFFAASAIFFHERISQFNVRPS